MKIMPTITKIFILCFIIFTTSTHSGATLLISPNIIFAQEKHNITTYNTHCNKINNIINKPYAHPNPIAFFGNNHPKEDLGKLYGIAYHISVHTKLVNFTTKENSSPRQIGEKIAQMLPYWPAHTVFLALLYNDQKNDIFPKMVITETYHIIVSYNDGTLAAINKISPIIAMFDITDDVECHKQMTKTDNYWIAICKAISVAAKSIRIESVGPKNNEPIVA